MSKNIKKTSDTAKKKKMSRSELESEIESSNKVNALLRKKIATLEKKVKTLQAEVNSHPNIETNLVKLQKKIAKIEKENLNYLEEIKTLKEELISKRHPGNVDKKAGETEKEITEVPKGRVHELVMKKHALMERKEISEETSKEISSKPVVNSIAEPEISTKTSDLIKEQRKVTLRTSEGRIKCPECGNQNKRVIRESIDRTYLISVTPRVYGKKFKCGECGSEWH